METNKEHCLDLTVRHYFDAAHQLPDTEFLVTKACARLHGHTYAVIVELFSTALHGGMVVDFKAIKNSIDVLDHQHINDIFQQHNFNYEATAENIARFIYEKIKTDTGIEPTLVKVCEGYKGEERASWVSYCAVDLT